MHRLCCPQESTTDMADRLVDLQEFTLRGGEGHPTISSSADCQDSCCFDLCLMICRQEFNPGAKCFCCLKAFCFFFMHVAWPFPCGAGAKNAGSGSNGLWHVSEIWVLLQHVKVLLCVIGDLSFIGAFFEATYATECVPRWHRLGQGIHRNKRTKKWRKQKMKDQAKAFQDCSLKLGHSTWSFL